MRLNINASPVMLLLLGPPLLMLGDLYKSYERFGVTEYCMAAFVLATAFAPWFVARKQRMGWQSGRIYVGRLNGLVLAVIMADLLSRIWLSGGPFQFADQLLIPRGYKAWETGGEGYITNPSLAAYAGIIDPALCAVYLGLSTFNVRIGKLGAANLMLILAETAFDANRLQFGMAAFTAVSLAPRALGIIVGVPLAAGVLMMQSALRSAELSAGVNVYAAVSGAVDDGIADGSFLGQLNVVKEAKLFGSTIEPGPVFDGMVSYPIPRWLWPDKPRPSAETWLPYKESWMAIGLLPEWALLIGVVPALAVLVALYAAVSLWLIALLKAGDPRSITVAIAIALTLFWTPRSVQSTIQFAPLIIVAYLLAWIGTRTFRSH